MADLKQLATLYGEGEMIDRISAALVNNAQSVLNDLLGSTAAEKAHAVAVFTDPKKMAQRVLRAVLASRGNATPDQIRAVLDGPLQAAVDRVVPLFVEVDAAP